MPALRRTNTLGMAPGRFARSKTSFSDQVEVDLTSQLSSKDGMLVLVAPCRLCVWVFTTAGGGVVGAQVGLTVRAGSCCFGSLDSCESG